MKHKKLISLLAVLVLLLALPAQAFACTTVYVGSNLTVDGSSIFGRSEDYSSDYAKLYAAVPAGVHTAGEEYFGCYGFRWVFTHDSYAYTAFCDDNSQGVCPDCDGTHAHTPYQAAGTNEMGLTVTATETLHGLAAVTEADPFPDEGIEEAEIPTVLLSEAATAREALELLTSIYATVGANAGSGIVLADQSEAWYVENLSGTQYLAVKLNGDLLFVEPNTSAIGLVDLDDAENIYASEALIETAVDAGTFVGDADANVINFAASYANPTSGTSIPRLSAALNYLTGTEAYSLEEAADPADYTISNLSEDGSIVLPYTNIVASKLLSKDDVLDLYKVSPIGKAGNTETHVFQITEGAAPAVGTIEWVSMDNALYNAFVPFYPMLTTEVYEAYGAGHDFADYVEEEPAEGTYFAARDGWVVYPEDWKTSFYWVYAALSHVAEQDAEAAAHITEVMATLQAEINADWAAAQEAVATAGEAAAQTATDASADIAGKAYAAALALLEEYGL